MTGNRLTRREAIVAGAAALAGCSGLSGDDGDSRGSVSSYRLPDVTDDGEPTPVVVESIPVEIESSHLHAGAGQATERLAQLPIPLSADDIPNGYIRRRLTEAAADATTAIEAARTARSRLAALQSVHEARSRAGYAATGWAVADDGRTTDEVRSAWHDVVSEAESVRQEHRYVGVDPVRAALVHAQIEERLERVLSREGPPHSQGGPESLLATAAWGERVAWGRADVADSRHLGSRFAASLPADAESVAPTLRSGAERVFADLRERRETLPPEPTEGDRELIWRLRNDLRREAEDQPVRVDETAGPASAVVAATEGLAAFLAYDRLRERIESGDRFRVEEVEDIREARSTAVAALRTALDESPRPDLARPVVADAARGVAAADAELDRYSGDVRFARLDDPVRRYTRATVRARSVPAACQRVIDALDGEK
jgi:hypothetical protein